MYRFCCSFIFFVFIIFNNFNLLFSQNEINSELTSIKQSFQEIYYKWDIPKYNSLNTKINSLIKKYPNNWHLNYYSGFVNLNLGKILYTSDEKKAFNHFDNAVERFYKAVELNPTAEVLALLSASYGKKSSLSGLNAIFWGIKSKNRIFEANEKDSNSTAVLLTAATHLMHTPKIYGGDKKKAMQLLLKAIQINESKKIADNLLIEWAQNAEIYAYIAQIYVLENNISKAEEYIKKALIIEPKYDFVLIDLKKQIENLK